MSSVDKLFKPYGIPDLLHTVANVLRKKGETRETSPFISLVASKLDEDGSTLTINIDENLPPG